MATNTINLNISGDLYVYLSPPPPLEKHSSTSLPQPVHTHLLPSHHSSQPSTARKPSRKRSIHKEKSGSEVIYILSSSSIHKENVHSSSLIHKEKSRSEVVYIHPSPSTHKEKSHHEAMYKNSQPPPPPTKTYRHLSPPSSRSEAMYKNTNNSPSAPPKKSEKYPSCPPSNHKHKSRSEVRHISTTKDKSTSHRPPAYRYKSPLPPVYSYNNI